MTYAEAYPWLEPVANAATILTAVVALLAYGGYRIDRKRSNGLWKHTSKG